VVPTQQPFLYTVSVTATDGTPLDAVERATLQEIDRVRRDGITPAELQRARHQLRARLVFEGDSITNIGHQLGYFETIASWRIYPTLRRRIDAVTLEQVAAAASRLTTANRTIGWFQPSPVEPS
jgi:zinc protease